MFHSVVICFSINICFPGEGNLLFQLNKKSMSQRPPPVMDFETELADKLGRAGKAQMHGLFCAPILKQSKYFKPHVRPFMPW